VNERNGPGPPPPIGGDAIVAEAQRLGREPIRIRCLGLSLGWLLAVLFAGLGLWLLLR
jgi:hypothetical protein